MADEYMTEMLWGRIAELTVKAAAGTLLLLTAGAAWAVHAGRAEKAGSERIQWTDKNRWE